MKQLALIQQQLAQLIEVGNIVSVNEATGTYIVDIDGASTTELVATAPRAGSNKSGDLYEPGEQVLIVCPCGDLRQGIIIGAINSKLNPNPTNSKDVKNYKFEDGSVVSYDKQDHVLNVQAVGAVKVSAQTINLAADNITIAASSTLNLTADTLSIEADNGDMNIDGVSFINHPHLQNTGDHFGGGVNTNKPSKV
ncbi:MAG: hypothetical protein COA90_00900 [Gammaproteobacteria bacterium]|nr:MAG: hypothetical protein COA90_00900 [Gammaproteobacteria bacterium]